ncbi:uncharacterized protein LOC121397894 [Xenopus laevis]|uniref:Uncharacterized protein LOC121397894 n=2 Tax=Xenopus laevis TaxID=8355 RepID=A0A1L8ESH0_XENLA|nr:uncharacterized protein LOC121397894 [Xenopus laevis]OCT62271.1 hypothetical protein XELAEV_18043356mg [Xenopus laevis]
MSEDSIPSTATTFAYDEEDVGRILSKIEAVDLLSTQETTTISTEKELFNLRRKEIHTSLHVSSLAEYLKVKRIPRGLRLDIKPNLCAENTLLQQRWFEICNKCSQDLMLLTVETLTVKLQDVRTAVSNTQEKLVREKGKEQAEMALREQDHMLSKLRDTIINRKRSKFERDARDYKEGREYSWRDERRMQRTLQSPRHGQADYPQPYARTGEGSTYTQPPYTRRKRYHRRGPFKAPREITSSSEDCSVSSAQSSAGFLGPATMQTTENRPRNPKAPNARDDYPMRNRKTTR